MNGAKGVMAGAQGRGGRAEAQHDSNTDDISSFDPTHLSIPTDTDFDFDSFFPHNSHTTATTTTTINPSSTTTTNNPTASTGMMDPTMDSMDFGRDMDMGDISGIGGGLSGFDGPLEAAFLDEVPSPSTTTTAAVPASSAVGGSPVQHSNRTRTKSDAASPGGRKRKSDLMSVDELEGVLIGANAATNSVSAGSTGAGGEGGGKVKRRKD
jgi:hypothetical protein